MNPARATWALAIAGAAILAVTMGIRQSLGLFVSPLNTSTGLGIVAVSFTLAVGQFAWGAAQPVFGAFVDRAGSARIIILGAVLMAVGLVGTTLVDSRIGLVLFLGVLISAGAGAGSFSIIMAAAANRLPPERRAMASGVINTGASIGQFVFAPLSQALIAAFGWVVALWSLAAVALSTIPLALTFRERPGDARPPHAAGLSLGGQVREAFRDPSYLCLHAGFFTCGFHVAFLVTHLPGEVALCGLPASVSAASLAIIGLGNIARSLGAGWLGQSVRMKWILFGMYAARAAAILAYLALPKTPATLYAFSALLGLTWLATVPMTAGIVGKLFGVRYLATLFGLTLFSHQVGAFFGAWLGGIALDRTGSYDWMWYADAALAFAAALVNLPIREASPVAKPA